MKEGLLKDKVSAAQKKFSDSRSRDRCLIHPGVQPLPSEHSYLEYRAVLGHQAL